MRFGDIHSLSFVLICTLIASLLILPLCSTHVVASISTYVESGPHGVNMTEGSEATVELRGTIEVSPGSYGQLYAEIGAESKLGSATVYPDNFVFGLQGGTEDFTVTVVYNTEDIEHSDIPHNTEDRVDVECNWETFSGASGRSLQGVYVSLDISPEEAVNQEDGSPDQDPTEKTVSTPAPETAFTISVVALAAILCKHRK